MPGYGPPPPGQHLRRPTQPYGPPPRQYPPTAQYPQQQPPQYPQQQYPGRPPMPGQPPMPPPGYGYPRPPGTHAPPWLQYPGHQHLLAPRPKSNSGALVATIVVAVLVGAVGLVGLLALNDKGDAVADTGYDSSTSTTETTSSEPEPTTTYETSTTTEDTTTDEETTDDTPTETTREGPEPVYALADNPLFSGDVGTPAVTCSLARWDTSPAGAAAFFQSALPCLDAAWQPIMEYQGLPFFTPGIAFPEGTEWSSPCGTTSGGGGAVAAFYCSADNTLYMPFAGLQTEMYGAHPGVYLAVLAHEYGHHVQAMSGVLDTYGDARYNAGVDTEAGLELSRRLELQAQCFSGMFLAAHLRPGLGGRQPPQRGADHAGPRRPQRGPAPRPRHRRARHRVVGTGRAAQPHVPVQHLAVAARRRGLTLRPGAAPSAAGWRAGPCGRGTRTPRPRCRSPRSAAARAPRRPRCRPRPPPPRGRRGPPAVARPAP